MEDPTRRRSPGTWPRDRPIRWGGVAGGLLWFVVSWLALLAQLALAIPTVIVGSYWGGVIGVVVAVAWGLATIFTAWSWVLGRWRVVLGPVLYGLALMSLIGIFPRT